MVRLELGRCAQSPLPPFEHFRGNLSTSSKETTFGGSPFLSDSFSGRGKLFWATLPSVQKEFLNKPPVVKSGDGINPDREFPV